MQHNKLIYRRSTYSQDKDVAKESRYWCSTRSQNKDVVQVVQMYLCSTKSQDIDVVQRVNIWT